MKYLSNYKIFLEEKEETETTDQTTKDPKYDLEKGIVDSDYSEEENKNPEETKSTENPSGASKGPSGASKGPSGASNGPSGDSKADNSNQKQLPPNPTDKEVSEILQKIVQKINTAFDASTSGYYFRKHVNQHSLRGWRLIAGGDNEDEAIIDFLGHTWENTSSAAGRYSVTQWEEQHRSWWLINVSVVLQQVDEESIVKTVDDEYLNKVKNDLKKFMNGEIWTEIRDGLKKRKNSLDISFQSFALPIEIVPNIGHGGDEKSWNAWFRAHRFRGILPRPKAKDEKLEEKLRLEGDAQTIKKTNDIIPLFEEMSKRVDELKKQYQDPKIDITHDILKEFYNISHDILCIFDYIFRRCENCFKKHKGWIYDDETALMKQLRSITDAGLLPLLEKINKTLASYRNRGGGELAFNIGNNINHLIRENNRIKDRFLPALYRGLKKEGWKESLVQFQINTYDKNERILVSIDPNIISYWNTYF